MNSIPNQAFTHAGKFHADDVFSAALLTLLNPEITIERGFKVPENYPGIVFDIGNGPFDHHQIDKEYRENGSPYAAFGLLFKSFGHLLVSKEQMASFDESFIEPLDLNDNLGTENEIAKLISRFNPCWDGTDNQDLCFEKAKNFAITILENQFRYMNSTEKAKKLIAEQLTKAQNGILILNQFVPFKKNLLNTNIDFVIYPSQRGGYCAQSTTLDDEMDTLKYPFPEKWRGQPAELLPAISEIATLKFCHTSGFLLSTETLDDCIKACKRTKELHNLV